jgi:hypothetical protein
MFWSGLVLMFWSGLVLMFWSGLVLMFWSADTWLRLLQCLIRRKSFVERVLRLIFVLMSSGTRFWVRRHWPNYRTPIVHLKDIYWNHGDSNFKKNCRIWNIDFNFDLYTEISLNIELQTTLNI